MPLTAGLIVGGASILGSVATGAIASAAASGNRQAAQQAATDAYNTLIQQGLPPDQSKALVYQQFQQSGNFTPEMQQDIEYGVSQAGQVKGNAQLQQVQQQALQQLQARGQVGLTAQDRAALAEAQSQAAQQTQGATQAILQAAQARGQGGAGATLAAQLIAAQQGGNRASQNALNIGGLASQNALNAILQGGQMAGQIENQQFGEKMQAANANDQFSRLNTQAQIARNQANTQQQNQAQLYNLQQKQQLQNMNTSQANQEILRQQQAQLNNYNMNQNRLQAIANAHLGQATQYQNQADAAAKGIAQTGAGVVQGIGAMTPYLVKTYGDNSTPNVPKSNNSGLDQSGSGGQYDPSASDMYNQGK